MLSSEPSTPATASDTLARPAPEGGRRDRKKHATRQALRNAALDLVAERGFAHVTIEDITEAADVATRTFFNYFPSKESAVIGADPERIEQIRLSLLGRPLSEAPLEALREVTLEYLAAIDADIDDLGEGREAWFRRFCVVRSDPDLLGVYVADHSDVERVLVATLGERLGKDPVQDPYPALVTAAVFAVTRVAALFWSANGGEGSLAELTGKVIDSLAAGFSNDKMFVVESRDLQRESHRTTASSILQNPTTDNAATDDTITCEEQ